ncbi:MAG: cytochrome c3 family protein [Acidobacteria bacterium]|nr:cytochrome c3 family protein [Acidobacteriota bacterium]
MSQIFPEWTNRLPIMGAIGGAVMPLLAVGGIWYFGSPEYTDVGYQPHQPIPYSHRLHAGELSMDCRYCHASVEVSAVANIPPTKVCMNCHTVILRDSDKLALLRESLRTGEPIHWLRVHKLPDYAYFNHGVHVRAGVGCASCHGRVDEMEVVRQVEPLSMSWCLDCHREPARHLRPLNQVTNMRWSPPPDQLEFASGAIGDRQLKPPTDCSGCHR